MIADQLKGGYNFKVLGLSPVRLATKLLSLFFIFIDKIISKSSEKKIKIRLEVSQHAYRLQRHQHFVELDH